MPLLKREKRDKIGELIYRINSVRSKEQLDSLESDLAALELKKSEAELREVYEKFARKYMEFGDFEKAYYYANKTKNKDLIIETLEKWGKLDKIVERIEEWNDAKYYPHLIKSLWNMGNYNEILKKYEKFYEKSKDIRILYYAASAYINSGNLNKSQEIIERIKQNIKNDYDKFLLHYLQGKYYEITGNYEEGIKEYKKALEFNKNSKDALIGIARCNYFLDNLTEVEKVIIRLPRDDPRVKALEALIMAKRGFIKGSLKLIDNVLEVEENSDALLAKCIIMYEHGIEGVEKYLDKILSVEPNNPIALKIKAKIIEKENREEAKKIYEKILKINPHDSEVYSSLAKLCIGEEKKKYAEKALEINPKNIDAKIILGEYFLDVSPEKSIEYLKGIEDPYAFYLTGIAYEKIGNVAKAEEYLRRALTMDKKNVKYKKELAKVIMNTKKEEAEILFRDVLKEIPDDKESKVYLASIIYEAHPEEAYELLKNIKDKATIKLRIKIAKKLGYVDEVKELVEKIAEEIKDLETLFALAEVSEKDDAINILNRILEIEPENQKAKIMLAEIYLDENPKKTLEILEGIDTPEANKLRGRAYESMDIKDKAFESYLKCVEDEFCIKKCVEIGISVGRYNEILEYAKKIVERDESLENLKLLAKVYENIDLDEAYEIHRKITMKNPKDKDSWEFLYNYYIKRKKLREGANSLDKLYEITGDINYLIKKSEILEEIGDYNELYEIYSKILSVNPNLEEIEDKRDTLLIKMGKYKELIEYAEYWLSKKKTKAAKGYYLRALAYKNLGNIKEALKNISKAISLSRKKEYRILYAEILYEMGKVDEAYEILEKMKEDEKTIMLKARILKGMGKVEEAIELLKKAAEMNVKDAYGEIAKAYIELGRIDEATEYIEKASEYLKDPSILLKGGEIYYNIGNYKKAVNYVNRYIRKNPNSEEGWLLKSLILLKMGEMEEALTAINNLIKISPKEEYLLIKGHILNKMGEYNQALNILESISEKTYEGINSLEEKAYALYKLKKYKEGRKLYEKIGNFGMVALCLYEENRFKEILNLNVEDSKVWEIKGDVYIKKNDVDKAKECYLRSIEIDEKNFSAIKKLAKIYMDEGKHNEAFELYSKVEDEESMLMRAKILESWGSYEEASKIYSEIFKKNPSKENGLRAAKSLEKVSKYNESLEILNSLPEDEDVMFEKAKVYYLKGYYKKSLSLLRKIEKEDFEVYKMLGDNYFMINRPLRAKDYYEKCLKIKEDAEVFKSLGKVYELLGMNEKAANAYMKCGDEESYERAEIILTKIKNFVKLKELYERKLKEGVDVDIMKKLADIYEKMGMWEDALKIYEEIKKYDFSAEILRKIAKINLLLGNIKEGEKYAKLSLELEENEEGYLLLGRVYTEMGMYDKAKSIYMKCKENRELNKEICRLAVLTNDVKNSLIFGEKSVKEIGDGESWFLYGIALSLARDFENAIKSLKISEEKGYDQNKIRVELAKIHIMKGEYFRALKILEYVNSEEARILKALCNAKMGYVEKAYELIEGFENGDAYIYLGDSILHKIFGGEIAYYPTKVDEKEIKKAIELYSKGLGKNRKYTPENAILNNMGVGNIFINNMARGAEEIEASSLDDTNILNTLIILEENDEVEKRIKKMEESHTKDFTYWNAVGIYMAKLKNYSEAIQRFNLAEELCSDANIREFIVFNRAVLLLHLGMYKSASELLTSIKIRDALLLRAYAYLKLNMFEESKKNYYEYLKNIKDGDVLYNLSYIEYISGNYNASLKLINDAIKHNPKDAMFWNLKGILLTLKKKYSDALRCFDVALYHNKNNDAIKNNKAVALILSGKAEQAVNILKEINTPLKDFNLGCAYYAMGEYDKAEEYLRRYYEKTKDNESLYNIFKASIAKGEPPELKKRYTPTKTEYILSDLLLSQFGVRITAIPKVSGDHLVYSLGIKNVSGDTINPFLLTPFGEFGAGMSKKIGPIRPYEEVWMEYQTSVRVSDLKSQDEENPLLPGEDIEIKHIIYSKGIGAVDEVIIKNKRNYPLENVVITPTVPQGFGVYNEKIILEKLDPKEERVVKFALLPLEALKEFKDYENKYEEAKPKFEDVEIKETSGDFKYIFRLHLFEFNIPTEEAEYDFNIAKELIKKERRKLLLKAVEEVGEAIVSVEK